MAVTPNTDLYLLKCPLELDERNQINFANQTAQFNYFYSLPKIEAENFTYQRKDSIIRFPAHIDSLLEFNYVMYRNTNYTDKWFYAYITKMDYINDNMTAISIQTDVWQTWCFDLNFKKSFVEREHVEDDTFGKHTIPEGMECGEYVSNGASEFELASSVTDCYIAVQITDMPDDLIDDFGTASRIYGGLPNGAWVVLLDSTDYANFNNFIEWFDYTDKADGIVAMYIVPKTFAPSALIQSFESDDYAHGFDGYLLPSSNTASTLGNQSWTMNQYIDGYSPKNNKVKCYPYNYLLVSNNGGMDIDFHWEDFSTTSGNFTVKGIPNQGCDIKLIPTNYKRTDGDSGYAWSVSSQKLPTISWKSDYYLNWQATHGVNAVVQSANKAIKSMENIDVSDASTQVQTGGNFLVDFIGYAGQMLKSITSATSQYEASVTPDQAKGNANTGDINFSLGKVSFVGYKMSIKAEMAKVVDDYFTLYGYKVNEMKIPQFTSRQNWNYIKTIGCNVLADIPQEDLQSIKDMFNSGVTMWHNASTFLDYSQANNIV